MKEKKMSQNVRFVNLVNRASRTSKPIILPNECWSLLFVDETKLYILEIHSIDKQLLEWHTHTYKWIWLLNCVVGEVKKENLLQKASAKSDSPILIQIFNFLAYLLPYTIHNPNSSWLLKHPAPISERTLSSPFSFFFMISWQFLCTHKIMIIYS